MDKSDFFSGYIGNVKVYIHPRLTYFAPDDWFKELKFKVVDVINKNEDQTSLSVDLSWSHDVKVDVRHEDESPVLVIY